ncbi:hypothetical protein Pla163_17740 [Planctomycetes bacterium Pla163]|uniref:Uncharacterized protein n=1 Tax=Rohdeia mirabilis TaxID=2528008 RepID=A0A518CZM9_9BACT|nr:hypothetical protein Pla163_17740 [Planctomycetes bacterium Pla163]
MRQRLFRPGFDLAVEAAPARVEAELAAHLRSDAPLIGTALGGHLMLTVPADERHFWSPYLHLSIEAHRTEVDSPEPARSYVRGFFTPHPSLWTAFMLTYLALGTVLAFACMWALVQVVLDEAPWALGAVGVALLAAAVLFAIGRVGLGLATAQMSALRAEVEVALGRAGAFAPPAA